MGRTESFHIEEVSCLAHSSGCSFNLQRRPFASFIHFLSSANLFFSLLKSEFKQNMNTVALIV